MHSCNNFRSLLRKWKTKSKKPNKKSKKSHQKYHKKSKKYKKKSQRNVGVLRNRNLKSLSPKSGGGLQKRNTRSHKSHKKHTTTSKTSCAFYSQTPSSIATKNDEHNGTIFGCAKG